MLRQYLITPTLGTLTLQAIRDAVADHRGDIDTYTARQDDGVF